MDHCKHIKAKLISIFPGTINRQLINKESEESTGFQHYNLIIYGRNACMQHSFS